MFLARYNPWGKTKRDQLQSWNNLSFDPQKTDIDEQIDLVSTLGNMLGQDEQAKIEKFIETMPTIIQTHLIIEPNWLLPQPLCKVWEQLPAYIHMLHNPKIKILIIYLSHLKVQKVQGERNQVKTNKNFNNSLNHLHLPQKKRNTMKRQTIIIIMKTIEAIIIMVIIKAEVDMAVVVIITEVMAMSEAVIKAITITNTTKITHMMMAHRWSNMAHHVHFAVVSITCLSTVLMESMT